MVHIRRAIAADTGKAIDLMNKLESTYNFQVTNKEKNLARFEQYIANDQYIVFISEDQQQHLQGIITLSPVVTFYAEGEMGMINEFYVEEQYRSQGLAKKLMDKAKDYAEQQGWQTLELSTPHHVNNSKAQGFYKKEGFEDFGIHFSYDTSHASY